MKVFKFGGASVKDANAVTNVARIIQMFEDESLIVVVSAMGKTTNAMEKIMDAFWNKKEQFQHLIQERLDFHMTIINDLNLSEHSVSHEIAQLFKDLSKKETEEHSDNYSYEYDQIVSIGELASTKIIAAYLNKVNVHANWLDARKIIRTDSNFQEGRVDWEKTTSLVQEKLNDVNNQIHITQGFIGHTPEGLTTTLGREGSDFTAGILAYVTDAESVTIWKDVPGMLNADPKWFENTIKLDQISFREAIELSYYGASVIHPKTIKPLQNKNIPLFVKSFLDPTKKGTVIQSSTEKDANIPSFIFKMNQILVSFSPKDFSFIMEDSLGEIFNYFASKNYKINLMQNSALNFSVCLDMEKVDIEQLIIDLSPDFQIKYNDHLELVTVRHYNEHTIERIIVNKEILIEQKSRHTARMIMKNIG